MLNGDCNVCINGKLPSYSATCVECGLPRKNYKPIINADMDKAEDLFLDAPTIIPAEEGKT